MGELPSGTVTFLFTDIEGSTRLLHEVGSPAYAAALAEHRRALRAAFAAHDGVEVDTQGDAFFVAFPTAPGALAAAAELTDALAGGPIRVRVGVHTGTPFVAEEGYVGVDVHRAARIAAAGHGGQVLVSASTAALADGADLRDLGEHRFKDLSAAERVFQLGCGDFPPLRTLYQTNLPVPATPFLGRTQELAEIVALLARDDVRLVTLTGPGGTGKTRLALEAVGGAYEAFPDGVWWVPLAPLRSPELVLSAVGQALDVREELGRPLLELLAVRLTAKGALLLLDNLEHLLPGAAEDVAALLAACQTLTVAVTSRERLRIAGEHTYPVPSLADPDGVELFTSRARQADPTFTATGAVTELCLRLDNLPLALELAAARTAIFSPSQLIERLGQRLDLLEGGRDADPRQKTLRATIAWSHDLLDESEQRLFARLSLFSGGCTYEAAEAVCEADPDTLQSLLDKSLLRRRTGGAGEERFWMLETIREFAAERLHKSIDTHELMARHAAHYLAFAEREEGYARGVEESDSFRRLQADLDNLRVANETAVSSGDADVALRLAGALHAFWYHSSRFAEGERRATQALALGGADTARPKALGAAGELAMMQGNLETARGHFEENLTVCLEFDDATNLAKAHTLLGHLAGLEGDSVSAIQHYEQTLELIVAGAPQDAWLTRGLALANLGWGSIVAGDLVDATRYLDEALIAVRAEGSQLLECAVLLNLTHVALERHDVAVVREHIRQALPLLREVPDKRLHVEGLELLARALAPTEPERAARLQGAAARLRADAILGDLEPLPHDDWLAEARSRLGDRAWEAAEAHGQAVHDPFELASQYLA